MVNCELPLHSFVLGVRKQRSTVSLDDGREAEQRGGDSCACVTTLTMAASNWMGERERERETERERERQRERERDRERERQRERERDRERLSQVSEEDENLGSIGSWSIIHLSTWNTVGTSDLFFMCTTAVDNFPHATLPKSSTASSRQTAGPRANQDCVNVWTNKIIFNGCCCHFGVMTVSTRDIKNQLIITQ